MAKKAIMFHVFLVGLYGIMNGASQPVMSGQTIVLSGKLLNSLALISSNHQSTALNITGILPMFGTSVQAWFNAGNSVTFSVSSSNPYGNGLVYNLAMMKSYGGTTDYAPLGPISGEPNFEILYNNAPTGYYLSSGVTQFTIKPAMTFSAITVPARATNIDRYAISLGNYFPEIVSMSFMGSNNQEYSVGAVQIAALNTQYQRLLQGSKMSIRIKGRNQSFVALFGGQSPYTLLQNGKNLGFPLKIYINNELVATVGSPLANANPNGELLCILQK